MNQSLTQQRLRIRYGKSGPMRFVGHLDLAKTWERILRRTSIPLEYSQGFNPRPRMQFAAALPVGVTSTCEYLDIWLTEHLAGDTLPDWSARLQQASPSGITLVSLTEVEIKSPALPTLVTHSRYVITLTDPAVNRQMLAERVSSLLAQATIDRAGHKKTYDLRPLILGLSLTDDETLIADLTTGEQGNARPDDLLDTLGFTLEQARVHRQELYLASSE